jgi:hypothetical protein
MPGRPRSRCREVSGVTDVLKGKEGESTGEEVIDHKQK